MECKSRRPCESLAAASFAACIRFFAGVSPLVGRKIGRGRESHVAAVLGARVRFFAGVGSRVDREVCVGRESLPAAGFAACERLLLGMPPSCMTRKRSVGRESHAAAVLDAYVRFFASVLPCMDLKIRDFCVSLATAGFGAQVRLLARVRLHMATQVPGTRESRAAAVLAACVWFFASVDPCMDPELRDARECTAAAGFRARVRFGFAAIRMRFQELPNIDPLFRSSAAARVPYGTARRSLYFTNSTCHISPDLSVRPPRLRIAPQGGATPRPPHPGRRVRRRQHSARTPNRPSRSCISA